MKNVNGWWFPDKDIGVSQFVESSGSYQKDTRSTAIKHCKGFNTALDIGGHVGLWAKDLAKLFKRVEVFEPYSLHLECLYKNIEGCTNIFVNQCGLGSEVHDTYIRIPNEKCSGGAKVNISENHADCEKIKIRVLDNRKFTTKIDFIKIDVEGYETFVLEGARNTIMEHKPVICVEQKKGYEEYNIPRKKLPKLLKSFGMVPITNVRDDFIWGWE